MRYHGYDGRPKWAAASARIARLDATTGPTERRPTVSIRLSFCAGTSKQPCVSACVTLRGLSMRRLAVTQAAREQELR